MEKEEENLKGVFYDALLDVSESNNDRLTIYLQSIKEIFIDIFKIDFYNPISDWSRLMPLLHALDEEEKIKLPKGQEKYESYSKYNFPKYIRLTKTIDAKKKKISWKNTMWHPKLSWVPEIERMGKSTFKRLLQLNDFLKTQPLKILPIPEKERSILIFGAEKELSRLASSTSIAKLPNRDIFEIASCYPTFEPLIGFDFAQSRSNKVLFIENRDTFLSMSKVCSIIENPPYKSVYYGQGLQFTTSVNSIPFEIEEGSIIEYFGDIDPTGFLIPCEAKRILSKKNKDYKFNLSVRLYHRLIEIHKQCKYEIQATEKRKTDERCFGNLNKEDKEYIIKVFQNNQRIPQELLNLGLLFNIFSNEPIPPELFIPNNVFLKRLYSSKIKMIK